MALFDIHFTKQERQAIFVTYSTRYDEVICVACLLFYSESLRGTRKKTITCIKAESALITERYSIPQISLEICATIIQINERLVSYRRVPSVSKWYPTVRVDTPVDLPVKVDYFFWTTLFKNCSIMKYDYACNVCEAQIIKLFKNTIQKYEIIVI